MNISSVNTKNNTCITVSLGIIILNQNKAQMLLECIGSIFLQSYKSYVIVVVDNASDDNSCELVKLKFPEVIVLESGQNLGVAGGRNRGIQFLNERKIIPEYILFLDNDILVEKETIINMMNSFQCGKKIAIVSPKLLRPDGIIEYAGGINLNLITGQIRNIGFGEKDSGQYDQCSDSIHASGGIFMIKKSALDDIGYFDERFNPYGWEDIDLSLRLKRNGYLIYYNHRAVVQHRGGKSKRGFIKEYETSKLKNYFYLIKKHLSPWQLFISYLVFPFRILFVFFSRIKLKNLQQALVKGRK